MMKLVLRWLSAHRFLSVAALLGLVTLAVAPQRLPWVTRGLLGWNVAVVVYLVANAVLMLRADHERMRRVAIAQAESAGMVLAVVVAGAVASLVGIVVELATAKQPGTGHALPHILFALGTVAGAWLLLPTLFTLTYASVYYRGGHGAGLKFPDADAAFRPHYSDFLYFAFTIAVAAQTADVLVTNTAMRRLVLLQSLLSFVFNTAILAFSINIAASMF